MRRFILQRFSHEGWLIGWVVASYFVVRDEWSLAAYCWSVWAALWFQTSLGLAGSGVGLVRLLWRWVVARREPAWSADSLAGFWRTLGAMICVLGLGTIFVLASWYLTCWLFFFYGLFLSFFAEMEPKPLFGRNGFINSDLFSPLLFLLRENGAMVLALLLARLRMPMLPQQWTQWRQGLPFGNILVLHLFIVLMPFLTLGVWMILGEHYQAPVIVVLMGLFLWLARQRDALRTLPGKDA